MAAKIGLEKSTVTPCKQDLLCYGSESLLMPFQSVASTDRIVYWAGHELVLGNLGLSLSFSIDLLGGVCDFFLHYTGFNPVRIRAAMPIEGFSTVELFDIAAAHKNHALLYQNLSPIAKCRFSPFWCHVPLL